MDTFTVLPLGRKRVTGKGRKYWVSDSTCNNFFDPKFQVGIKVIKSRDKKITCDS